MKIQVVSDIHLEFLKNFEILNLSEFKKADYLFLAGDIGIPLDKYGKNLWLDFITWCSRNYIKVFYVIGNHESYGSIYSETLDHVRSIFSKNFKNVFLLEENVVCTLEDYKIVGCTLWTDIDHISSEYLNDTRMIEKRAYVPIDVEFIRNLHKTDKEWLERILEDLKDEKVIVMTHHLPSKKCVDPKYKDSKYEKGFVAHVDNLISKSNLWIFGHTHSHIDFVDNNTRLYANPLGYKEEHHQSNFKVESITLL